MSTTDEAGPVRRMFRYEVPIDGRPHFLRLSSGPVAVAAAGPDSVEFWAEHAGGTPEAERVFRVFGTGRPLPQNARWVGTCPRVSGLIWHLYELVSDEETTP